MHSIIDHIIDHITEHAVPILLILLALYLMVGLFNFWVFMQTPRSLTDPWWAMILLWPLYWDWPHFIATVLGLKR